jgi:rhodanese-related sulfurtransferase
MKEFAKLVLTAIAIAVAASGVGLGINMASSRSIPWVYQPPDEISVEDVKIPLVDEREAKRFFDDAGTVFIDTRHAKDYEKNHVKGALLLPPEEQEERFPAIEPLIPEGGRLILYCYGPDCDMAERVAQFLVPLGYKNLMIMRSGFRGWQQTGYPVERSSDKS